MDQAARAQARLILENADELARNAVSERLKALYFDHAARDLLQSGATVKASIRLMEEEAGRMITVAVDQVATVAKNIEAFAMIREAVAGFDRFLRAELDDTVAKATGGDKSATFSSVEHAAQSLFNEAQRRWTRQLEIHAWAFTQAFTSGVVMADGPHMPVPTKNKGGKPLAAHWDRLWATIAVQLFTGELTPKTQADIERAMLDWFNGQDLEIGETAIRQRARVLWQSIEAAN